MQFQVEISQFYDAEGNIDPNFPKSTFLKTFPNITIRNLDNRKERRLLGKRNDPRAEVIIDYGPKHEAGTLRQIKQLMASCKT